MTLHNAPPTHGQVTAVAVVLVLVALFYAVMFAVLLTRLRSEREAA